MSDPVTNGDMEDVLSSIRRLVSEERRPLQLRSSSPSLNGRLVLTPALRVTDPGGSAPLDPRGMAQETWDEDDAIEDGASRDQPPGQPAKDEAAQDRNRGVENGNHGHGIDGYWLKNPPGGEPPKAKEPLFLRPSEAAGSPEDASRDTNGPKVERPTAAVKLPARIASLESAIGPLRGEFEPDEPGSDVYSGTDAPRLVWQDDVELDGTGRPVSPVDLNAGQTATDDPAEIEAPMWDDTNDPETADETGLAPVFHAKPRNAARQAESAPETQGTESGVEPVDAAPDHQDDPEATTARHIADAAMLAEDHPIDEVALRELVSEIVRSELQGALGQRITRNVRKLVRREIHRALAAQELE